METVLKEHGGHTIACIRGEGIAFSDAQGALDFMHTLYYHTRAARIALPKSAVPEGFFDLSTGIAGDILQKFVNYSVKLALWGNFGAYTSPALAALIRESNRGGHIFFCADEEAAVAALGNTP